jgi:hypothetical protein
MDEQAIVKLVPGTADSDAEGVKMSLEAARALAMGGEPEEALRLVRRAAEAAEQAGDDMRSIALARAAADIANEIERVKKGGAEAGDSEPSSKKLPSPPSRKSVPTPPPMPASAPGAAPHAPTPASTRAAHAPPAPSGKSSPEAAPPPEAAADARPAPAAAHSEVTGDHAEPTERQAAAARKVEARPAPAPQHASSAQVAPPPGISELVSQGRAVRVLVKRSARDESLYIVRPHATAHVPVGAREAFLVLGDADPEFLAGANR